MNKCLADLAIFVMVVQPPTSTNQLWTPLVLGGTGFPPFAFLALQAVTEQEEKQLKQGFMDRMQALVCPGQEAIEGWSSPV